MRWKTIARLVLAAAVLAAPSTALGQRRRGGHRGGGHGHTGGGGGAQAAPADNGGAAGGNGGGNGAAPAGGVNFMWFGGLNGRSDIDFHAARSAGVVVPINEYQLAAALAFSYVPVYGKFLMFNQYIFHWDLYVMAGLGLIRTRPIPDIDP